MKRRVALFTVFGLLFCANTIYAQLDNSFKKVFDFFLKERLRRSGETFHGLHYLKAAADADSLLKPALNSLIATNVSSFPLSSTGTGVTFDFSSGRPVSIRESLGPIFAESAQTLGKGKLNLGINYTYLNLAKFRGLSTKDIRFSFTHVDVQEATPPPPSLGNPSYENDYVDVFLGLDVNASIAVLSATYGLTNSLDLGLAVPVVHVSLAGNAKAVINSYSFGRLVPGFPQREGAAHRFNDDPLNPLLTAETRYEESATGIGDIALRLKYNFSRGADADLAAFLDLRLPTGDEKNFLGTGKANARISGVASKKMGQFAPHLNLAYDRRGAAFDSDELELVAGFDQKIASSVSFAADFLGSFDLKRNEAIKLFPGVAHISDQFVNSAGTTGRLERAIDLSNIPDRDNDNTLDIALGFRAAPSARLLLLGNILVPLNDGGLRSSVAPTFGATINF